MKITKMIEVETEVSFSVSIEEITDAMAESERGPLWVLNNCAQVLQAVKADAIAGMNPEQRRVVEGFLRKEADRYLSPEPRAQVSQS